MRYLVWLLRLVIFVIVLLFALKNTAPVDVGFFADHVVQQVPLIVVMLAAFVLGLVFGLLVAFSAVLRRRREINRLRRELARAQDALAHPPVHSGPVIPETVAPLAPL
ncbi:LapA family protein [Castellaniella caeni]|uniref:LapA family protein n=1 Tax=Castellaniella caeni TaxID=266123 RepID=UPI00083165C3|nr:lipopolysaccharide assembly protein LapA domain-containing protein [Castellaniella caeni]